MLLLHKLLFIITVRQAPSQLRLIYSNKKTRKSFPTSGFQQFVGESNPCFRRERAAS